MFDLAECAVGSQERFDGRFQVRTAEAARYAHFFWVDDWTDARSRSSDAIS
jgi:hypothetical protein